MYGTLINQLSDADSVAVGVLKGSLKFMITSIYFDRGRSIEMDLVKIDAVLEHAKGAGVLIAMDSDSRSTLWYDTVTNTRGRTLEEYMTSNHLNIMNEDSRNTTFRNRIGSSNIDLTVISGQLLRSASGWEISGQKSNSDHSIIEYAIDQGTKHDNTVKFLKTKRRLLYLKTQFVPRSKHFPPRL